MLNEACLKIIRYEKARLLVNSLSTERSLLVSECESTKNAKNFLQENCLVSVFESGKSEHGDYYNGCGFDYNTLLEDAHEDGSCCDNCYKSFQIKRGPLAEAKQEFGNAKRALSMLGKKLIKLEFGQ